MAFALYLLVVTGCAAGVLLLLLGGLVVRRGWQESRVGIDRTRAAAFRAALLPLIARADAGASSLAQWRGDPVALDVSAHLLQLLRGGDRDTLLRLVTDLELLDTHFARLGSPRAAKRIAAIRRLGSFPAKAVGEALVHRLRYDPLPDVRLEAGLALVRIGRLPTVAKTLTALAVGNFDTPAHRIVFRALAVSRPGELLAAWDTHRGTQAAFALTDALGEIVDPQAFSALGQALRSPDPQLRCEALRSIRRIGHPSLGGSVVAALRDPEWIVRVQAASTAGAMRLETARAGLRDLLRDPQWWVRYRAEEALLRLPNLAAGGMAAA